MYFKDLTPCTYFDGEPPFTYGISKKVVAVGWIDSKDKNGPAMPFAKGETPLEFRNRLAQWCAQDGEAYIQYCGWHSSALDGHMGGGQIFVPYRGRIYACPAMISRYVSENGYKPPQAFINAVLNCPHERLFGDAYEADIRKIDEILYRVMLPGKFLSLGDHDALKIDRIDRPWKKRWDRASKRLQVEREKQRIKALGAEAPTLAAWERELRGMSTEQFVKVLTKCLSSHVDHLESL